VRAFFVVAVSAVCRSITQRWTRLALTCRPRRH